MACDTYSPIKFFVFQLLYLFQRHIERADGMDIFGFPGFHIQIIKGGTGQPHTAWDWHIEESERMSASSYADWSYIDMRYILHISTIRTLKHESYAQVQISTSKNLRHMCGSILYWNLLAMNISTIRNMWCIYRHQTYFETCDTNIYTPCAQVSPTWGGPRDMPLTTRGATNTPTNTQY